MFAGLLATFTLATTPFQDKATILNTYLSAAADFGFAGSVFIQKDGQTVLDKGYGELNEKPVTPETRFWICSLSKAFMAASILLLQNDHKLKTSTTLKEIFPRETPEDKANITIHQLLTHTSGLPGTYVAESTSDYDEALKKLMELKLVSAPGAKLQYSNDAYALLSLITERLSGQGIQEFMRQRILDPLKLTNTGFWATPEALTVAPMLKPGPAPITEPRQALKHMLFSTTHDLMSWVTALYYGNFFPEETKKQMFGQYAERAKGVYFGYGWGVIPKTRLGLQITFTGANDFGHNGTIVVLPQQRLKLVVQSASGETPNGNWSGIIAQKIIEVILPPKKS